MSNNGGTVVDKIGSSSSKPSTDNGGPIIRESGESKEYQEDLQVVVGTTIGVIAVVGLVVVAILLYRVYRSRQRALAYAHQNDDSLDRNISVDVGEKCQPVVLLLYANDCRLHQLVVGALAGFLMEVCGVTITLDLLEESEIIERGIDNWLVDRLQEADYIMVMCSLGARMRCSKKHVRFKAVGQQLMPDYFSIAVDYVSEKMRVEKQKGLSTDKFIVTYMDYSTQSDIPPQLETATRFCLMKDIHNLHTHLKTVGPESLKSDNGSLHSDCESLYHETETGAILKATIEQTKAYFKENPSWMDDCLEPSSVVPHWVGKSRKRQLNALKQPLLRLTNTLPSKPDHEFELSQQHSSHRWSSKVSKDVDFIPQSSSSMFSIKGHDIGSKSDFNKLCVFQGRQNSLPSSLASSGLITPVKQEHVSKSMDDFYMDSHQKRDHDGVPCLFCGNCHLEGVPECKLLDTPASLPNQDDSFHNLHSNLTCSHSQTVLQAEVHQEWGTPIRSNPRNSNKSNTFGGEPRYMDYDQDVVPVSPPAYKSLPPHQLPPSSTCDFDSVGKLRKWDNSDIDSSDFQGQDERSFRCFHRGRTPSQSSNFTNDSESVSDTDSLKRDLNSIQNIASFHDFVNSSLFVTSRVGERLPNSYLLPSFSSHLKQFQVFGQQRNQDDVSGVDIELSQVGGLTQQV